MSSKIHALTLDNPQDGPDYTMVDDAECFWVTIGSLSLYVRRIGGTESADGISVSVHNIGEEDDPNKDLGRMTVYYSDVEE